MDIDIEKQRAQYVASLEAQIRHMQQMLGDAQAVASWEPKVTVKVEADRVVVGMEMGGTFAHTAIGSTQLLNSDDSGACAIVSDALIAALVSPQIRALIAPQLQTAKRNVAAVTKAGSW